MVTPGPAEGDWEWTEGTVDRQRQHLQITYGSLEAPTTAAVALIARGSERAFVVQFLASSSEILTEVRQELDFYLTQWGGSDPWAYAVYPCGTTANIYSHVHWHYFPDGNAPGK